MVIAKKLLIKGLVQGVGFRPSIYRLAMSVGIFGTVENNNKGVIILIEGTESKVNSFIHDLPNKIPIASHITSIDIEEISPIGYKKFSIVKSTSSNSDITEVSPDISVCEECIIDMKEQPHRIDYAFINCTNCGPRFTIIRDLPYDRPKTTMDVFPMCSTCNDEYSNIFDRRFHAQPVACNDCGPSYTLSLNERSFTKIDVIINKSVKIIDDGGIIAVKGLGGFHIACDAFNEKAIIRLREIKNRDGRPLALMFKDVNSIEKHFVLDKTEKDLLIGWRKPIVLLKNKSKLSDSISRGLDRNGVMLPYMPLHYLLFENLKTSAIVLTSGNISDEPIIISNTGAQKVFQNKTNALITYDRDIYNRTDDSVAKIIDGKPRLIRRSRGYAPSPIETNLDTEGIFAAGAELVNCFAIGKGKQVILSQHIGDLKNLETLDFYEESISRYFKLFRFENQLAVRDLHPDYLSSKFCDKLNIPIISVQHHHAHIASCMAENNLDEKVIGISFDGTGLGHDNNIWGGEFFICDLDNYKRINHFEYIPQPGGDAVTKHPWRMMLSYLIHYFGNDIINTHGWLVESINKNEISLISSMLKNNINCPLTSSAGRLFDATSALLGVCREATYHSEAPMMLESISSQNEKEHYNFDISDHISFKPTFAEMIEDLKNGFDISIIGGKFHNTIIEIILQVVISVNNKTNINKVALSGGTFQNSILLEKAIHKLSKAGFSCYTQSAVPSNDGGLALGQLAIAAKRRNLKKI